MCQIGDQRVLFLSSKDFEAIRITGLECQRIIKIRANSSKLTAYQMKKDKKDDDGNMGFKLYLQRV